MTLGADRRVDEQACIAVVDRLRERQSEIEAAIHTRVSVMHGTQPGEDVEYQAGLRDAVTALVDHSLTCIARAEEDITPIPPAAIMQARRAARNGVSLATIVLRYIAGHRLLGEFVLDEVDRANATTSALRDLRRRQEALLEHLTAAMADEYKREQDRIGRSAGQRRAELVQRLLAGEPADAAELDYQLEDTWHLGVIAVGARAQKALQRLGNHLGRQILSVRAEEDPVWAWLGGRRKTTHSDIERALSSCGDASVMLAIGEPARGIAGWRATHQEAQAALMVALRRPQTLTRCADVSLEAAILRDHVLAQSLHGTFLEPLGSPEDAGLVLRRTLRAYFAAGHNLVAAAAALGVDRSTVRKRLQTIEHRLGRSLHTCQAELEVALRIEALEDLRAPSHGPLPTRARHEPRRYSQTAAVTPKSAM